MLSSLNNASTLRKILILIVINVLSYLPYVWVVEKGRFASQKYTFRHKFLKGLAKRASTKEYTVRSFGFHSLRRYVATYLSDKEKVATKTIQKILGHSSEATTERYLYNAHRDLEAVMELLGSDKASTEEGNEHTSQGGGALVH